MENLLILIRELTYRELLSSNLQNGIQSRKGVNNGDASFAHRQQLNSNRLPMIKSNNQLATAAIVNDLEDDSMPL